MARQPAHAESAGALRQHQLPGPVALQLHEPGHEIEGPMAIVILGGLVSSTLVSLLLIPPLASFFSAPRPRTTAPPERG